MCNKYDDLVDQMIRYEAGEMQFRECCDFFQGLIDSGMAYKLQAATAGRPMRLSRLGIATRQDMIVGAVSIPDQSLLICQYKAQVGVC